MRHRAHPNQYDELHRCGGNRRMPLVEKPINLAKRRQDASMMASCGEQGGLQLQCRLAYCAIGTQSQVFSRRVDARVGVPLAD